MKINRRGGIGSKAFRALFLSCTALAAISTNSAIAQDAAASSSGTELETIVIEGSGSGADDDARTIVATQTTGAGKMPGDVLTTPASVSVITSKEIQQRGAQDVEQVLQYTAGVATDFYGSDDRFDYFKIRGFDAYIYRDGLLLGDPFGSMREEPYAYERVEVLKGANSTGFGVSDPGGSVNFVTKTPKSARFGEAYVTGGSYGRAETGVDFGDNITEDDTLSYRITGKVRRADAEYDYSQDDENFIMGGLTWRPTDMTNLTVVYDHLDKDGVPGGGGHPVGSDFARSRFFGEPDYNYRDVDRDSVSVMFDHDFGNGFVFGSNARYSNTKSNFGYAYIAVPERGAPSLGPTYVDRDFFGNDSNAENFIVDANLQYDTTFADVDNRTLVGLEYNDNRARSDTFYGDAPDIDWLNPIYTGAPASVPLYTTTTNDNKTKALYLQQELTFSDRLTATLGLRNDWLDINQTNNQTGANQNADFSELSTRAALTYKITDDLATYVSYAESAVPAAVSVEPERGEQWELGVKYRPSEFPALFTAAVYELTKENITRNVGTPPVPTAVGEVRARGIDLEAKAELTNNISLTTAYSYVDTEIVKNGNSGNEGNRLAMVPEHLASAWLNYTLLGNGVRGDMTFGLGARYMGSYYFSDANTVKSDRAFVFDAAYSYKIRENTSFEVNVTNLFDEKHVANGGFGADFYNPGRAIYATLRQTW